MQAVDHVRGHARCPSAWEIYSFKQCNYSTVGGDGGCRVGKVRAGTSSPIPDHNGFKIQLVYVTNRHGVH